MRRRPFVAIVAGGTAVGTAGCLDDFTNSQSDQPDGDTESSPSIEETDSDNAINGENQDSEIDGDQTNDGDRETREEILELYQEAIRDTNTGTSHLNDAAEEQVNENYDQAITSASRARDNFSEAQEHLSETIGLTYEIGNSEARELCEGGEQYAGYLYDSARMQERSVEAAKDGNYDRVLEYLDDAEEYRKQADRVNPRDSGVMRTVLDLD